MTIGIIISVMIAGIVLLCSNIYINGSAVMNLHTQTLEINVYFYRLRLFKRSIDLMEQPDETYSLQDILSRLHKARYHLLEKINDFNKIFTIIMSRLRFRKCIWHTDIGAGDAHTTGIVSGGLWGAKGTVVGFLASKSQWRCQPSLVVTPFFNQKRLHSVMDCMISIRLGQAIYALLKIVLNLPVKREATI